ncbi:MAG: hypothetical protein JWL90_3964 [Chthoniobacteraceae bacterium]|nr:hypothetical protein [Chthoniobacteraceae bacterium]
MILLSGRSLFLGIRKLAPALFVCPGLLFGADRALLEQAGEALEEAIPQVAIHKLTAFLSFKDLPETDRAEAVRKLGEALFAAGQNAEALTAIEPLVKNLDVEALLLRAGILAADNRWTEALPIYSALAADPLAPMAARLGEVEGLNATGKPVKAIALLEGLVNEAPVAARLRLASLYAEAGDGKKAQAALALAEAVRDEDVKWKKYIEGRALLLEEQPAPALVMFREILRDSKHLTENMQVAAMFGMTDATIIMQGYETADGILENFLGHNPNSSHLGQVFRRLDDVYSREDDASESELRALAQKPPEARAFMARFYLARLQMRANKLEKASRTLEGFVQNWKAFVKDHPQDPLPLPADPWLIQVYQTQAELLLKKGEFAKSVAALESAEREVKNGESRAQIELQTGLVHYQAGEYLLAANLFDIVARRSPKLKETALYNGALAALNQRNPARFSEHFRELSAQFPQSPLRSELLLEQGLLQARVGDSRARESLQIFLRNFPRHARAAEARLAVAEFAMETNDPAFEENYRKVVNQPGASAEIDDQSRVLAIFLADGQTPRRDEAVIELALQFIRQRADSPLLPEVCMKLGEVYFRQKDFANAETQLVNMARQSPSSPYVESALYLAGQAAMQSINTGSEDRALALFVEVIQRDGPLKLYARHQQAIVQSRLGKESEAIKLYDIILNEPAAFDSELGFAALMGKGTSLLALGAHKEPPDPREAEYLGAAAAVFGQFAMLPKVPALWRNQALYKKAKAYELLGQVQEALASYYDVLAATTPADREFLWFYKAGSDAARIFEAQGQWKSAAGIYEKMSKLEGPGAAKAKSDMKRLRLEHFLLWEE